MQVETIHPGVTKEEIIAETGFELLWSPQITESTPPTEEELHILRTEVDPNRYLLDRDFS